MATGSGIFGAFTDLSLPDQLAGETEDERKKRLADEAQKKALGPMATPYGAASRTLGLGSYGASGGSGGY